MTIQMLRTWNGLEEDAVYTLPSAAEETRLIGLGLARDYRVGMDGSNPVFSTNGAAFSALVSTPGISTALPTGRVGGSIEPVASRWVLWGDSFAAQSVRTLVPTSITVSAGVATVAATGHGAYSSARASVTGAAVTAANVIQASVTRVDANNFTVPMSGVPDGALAVGPAALQVLQYERQTGIGLETHLQRLSNGGITIANIAGFPGYQTAAILAEFTRSVAAFAPHVVVIQCGYNDINANVAQATTLANYQQMIDSVTGIGAVALVQSIAPWGSGAAANSAANRIKVQALNRLIAAYCATNPLARFLDITALAIDPDTGLSKTGWVAADGVHPSCRFAYELSKLALAAVPRIKPRKFVSSREDNRTGDAASLNVARSMPSTNTTGGSLGTNVTGTVPAGEAGTAGVAAGWFAGGTSIPVGGGNAWIAAAPDGVGFAQACRWTMDAAGQQGRISYTLTNADFTPGEVVDLYFKASVTTAHAASNRTPAGQNITAIQGQLVFTNSDGTFTPSDWAATVPVADMLPEDMVSQAIVIENIVVPSGSAITLARLDLVLVFGGAGTAQAMVWRAEVRKRTA